MHLNQAVHWAALGSDVAPQPTFMWPSKA